MLNGLSADALTQVHAGAHRAGFRFDLHVFTAHLLALAHSGLVSYLATLPTHPVAIDRECRQYLWPMRWRRPSKKKSKAKNTPPLVVSTLARFLNAVGMRFLVVFVFLAVFGALTELCARLYRSGGTGGDSAVVISIAMRRGEFVPILRGRCPGVERCPRLPVLWNKVA